MDTSKNISASGDIATIPSNLLTGDIDHAEVGAETWLSQLPDYFRDFLQLLATDYTKILDDNSVFVQKKDQIDQLALNLLSTGQLPNGEPLPEVLNVFLQNYISMALVSQTAKLSNWSTDQEYIGAGAPLVQAVLQLQSTSVAQLPDINPPLDPSKIAIESLLMSVMTSRAEIMELLLSANVEILRTKNTEVRELNDLIVSLTALKSQTEQEGYRYANPNDTGNSSMFDFGSSGVVVMKLVNDWNTWGEANTPNPLKRLYMDYQWEALKQIMMGKDDNNPYFPIFNKYSAEIPDVDVHGEGAGDFLQAVNKADGTQDGYDLWNASGLDAGIKSITAKVDTFDDTTSIINTNMSRITNRYDQAFEMTSNFVSKFFQSLGTLVQNVGR